MYQQLRLPPSPGSASVHGTLTIPRLSLYLGHDCSSSSTMLWVQSTYSRSICPSSPPTGQSTFFSVGPQVWGGPTCSLKCSLPRVNLYPYNHNFPPSPLPEVLGGPGPITFLLSLSDYVSVFHTALIIYESFCWFSVFNENHFICRCIFDVFMVGGELHIL